MKKPELSKLEDYLQNLFDNDSIKLVPRPKLDDSAEVTINGEFIAIITKDIEDGETSYMFEMAILEEDLENNA